MHHQVSLSIRTAIHPTGVAVNLSTGYLYISFVEGWMIGYNNALGFYCSAATGGNGVYSIAANPYTGYEYTTSYSTNKVDVWFQNCSMGIE